MSTNQYIVTSAQIQPGDIITESGLRDEQRDTRQVRVDKVTTGEIWYHGAPVAVTFVNGVDIRRRRDDTQTFQPVAYTANGWRRWVIERGPVLETATA
jgi:hypothetical protein